MSEEQHDASQQQWLMQQLLPRRPHGALDAFRIHPEPLGTGAFARVLKATDHQGQAWALKLIQLPSEDSNTAAAPGAGGGDSSAQAGIQAAATSCVQEVQAQLHLSRFPSILPLHAAFRTRLCDPHGARPPLEVAVLQLPLMSCNLMSRLSQGRETIWGGLHTCRPHLSQQEVKSLFLQMVNAVRHCHEGGYSHQDIKAENFLIATD